MPKISQYTAVTTPSDSDELVVVQAGVTKKITLTKLADYVDVGSKPFTTATDPASNAACTTAIVNAHSGTIVTTTKAANSQTLGAPTVTTAGKVFTVVNNDTSTHSIPIVANSVTFTLTPGEGQCFLWDGTAWGPTDLGITEIPVLTTQGGTGRSTGTTAYALVATGTTATGAQQTLANGATTEILVGGGASALPVWTTATGTGAPVRATSPTLVTPLLGTPASGDLRNCSISTATEKGVTVYSGSTKALAGTDTASAMTPADVAAKVAVDVNPRAMSQGVAMTYAASGSSGIRVADNDNIDFGTGNFTLRWKGSIPDYTPSADVILMQKTDATNGWLLQVDTTGVLQLLRNAEAAKSSTAAPTITDGTVHEIVCVVTTETASVAGSVEFYVDGVALGSSVAITAGAPTTVNNAVSLYVAGTSAVRTASNNYAATTYNRALTAAEVLDLYRNGIAEADKWGSQTNLTTNGDVETGLTTNWVVEDYGGSSTVLSANSLSPISGSYDLKASITAGTNASYPRIFFEGFSALTVGKKYRVKYKIKASKTITLASIILRVGIAGDTISISDTLTIGTDIVSYIGDFTAQAAYTRLCIVYNSVASGNADLYIDDVKIYQIGATLALESPNIQPAPGQWLDSSSNKLHAMQPATGSSLIRPKRDFEYRWANTWTASSAAQYVGGLNRAVLSADHFITDIITQATVTTDVENLELGDGSAVAKFVAAFTPSATRTKQTIAAQNDGTNLKLVYTPAAEATMTVETIIRGFIWEP